MADLLLKQVFADTKKEMEEKKEQSQSIIFDDNDDDLDIPPPDLDFRNIVLWPADQYYLYDICKSAYEFQSDADVITGLSRLLRNVSGKGLYVLKVMISLSRTHLSHTLILNLGIR
ncbi:hypothetical protein FACS189472_16140 [Alphaproteobacteria bacterium]|nr:hypothetical protein FACS189472_16140 [Alphaproteobacteria bacterium]